MLDLNGEVELLHNGQFETVFQSEQDAIDYFKLDLFDRVLFSTFLIITSFLRLNLDLRTGRL